MGLAESVELVDQPFRMNPAQRMVCDPELASAVGDDDGSADEALRCNRAPQRPFGCNLNRVWIDLEGGDAEPLQMRHEGPVIGKTPFRTGCEQADGYLGGIVIAHVIESRRVDDIVRLSGPQQFEEIKPALRARRCKPGEAIVADMCAIGVLGLVPCASVIDLIQDAELRPARSTSPASLRKVS